MEYNINIPTKFAIGDTVFFISNNEILSSEITQVEFKGRISPFKGIVLDDIEYCLKQREDRDYISNRTEDQLYATADAAAECVKQKLLKRFNGK